jgi:hypothetical protein
MAANDMTALRRFHAQIARCALAKGLQRLKPIGMLVPLGEALVHHLQPVDLKRLKWRYHIVVRIDNAVRLAEFVCGVDVGAARWELNGEPAQACV